MKHVLILFIIIQIVLVIVAAYFIFRVYSCVFTINAVFAPLCAWQVCAFTSASIWIASIWLLCNRSLQIQANDPIEYVERNVRCYFIFRWSWNVKNVRESHQHPTHRLCTSGSAINFKLLKISKIVWEKRVLFILIMKWQILIQGKVKKLLLRNNFINTC